MGSATPPPPPPDDQKDKQPFKVNLFKGRNVKLPPSLTSLSDRLEKKPTEPREKAAWLLGTILVATFGASCIFIIWEGFRVVFFSMDQPEHTKILMTTAVIPFLEKVGTFLTTVFGPLLAFILGYYFGQKV